MIESAKLTNDTLKTKKEEWLDKLRMQKINLQKMQKTTKRIRNNILFKENQSVLFQDEREYVGQIPSIDAFVDFWGGIWEERGETPKQTWIEEIKKEIREKVEVKYFTIDEARLKENNKETEKLECTRHWRNTKILVENV